MRGLTLAVWIFCINLMFAIFESVNPFGVEFSFYLGDELITTAEATQNVTSVSFLGIPEMVMATNLFFSLLLGPLKLVPAILNLIGVTGTVNWAISGCVWVIYGWTMFQLITGKMLKEAR